MAHMIVETEKTRDLQSEGLRTNAVSSRWSSKVVATYVLAHDHEAERICSTDRMRPAHTGEGNLYFVYQLPGSSHPETPLTDTRRIILDQISEHPVA